MALIYNSCTSKEKYLNKTFWEGIKSLKVKSLITCIIITCIVTIVTIDMFKVCFRLIKTSNLMYAV